MLVEQAWGPKFGYQVLTEIAGFTACFYNTNTEELGVS